MLSINTHIKLKTLIKLSTGRKCSWKDAFSNGASCPSLQMTEELFIVLCSLFSVARFEFQIPQEFCDQPPVSFWDVKVRAEDGTDRVYRRKVSEPLASNPSLSERKKQTAKHSSFGGKSAMVATSQTTENNWKRALLKSRREDGFPRELLHGDLASEFLGFLKWKSYTGNSKQYSL